MNPSRLPLIVNHEQQHWAKDVSHEEITPTFRYTGGLIGILIMAYYDPYILGSIIPYKP